MAFSNDQQDSALPLGNNTKKTAVDFLPKYFKTSTNKKFLNATIDQMIDSGSVEKINAFIGRKTAQSYSQSDVYLNDISSNRQAYQFEPAVVIKDELDNTTFFKDYNDYINQLNFFNSVTADHSKVNGQEYYSWTPHISWDKFVNYREYYWLPTGPQTVSVAGKSDTIVSTIQITLSDEGDNQAYIFTPDGLTRNPTVKLYRGETYRFEIDCPGQPIAFSTTRTFIPSQTLIVSTEDGELFTGGLYDVMTYDVTGYDLGVFTSAQKVETTETGPFNVYNIWTEGITAASVYVEKGTIEFKIPDDAPDAMFYVSKNDINTSGIFKILDITEASSIDVETEVIGKKTYTSEKGITLTNGMKIKFIGRVTPQKYDTDNWYVEGVGDRIYLVAETDLETPAIFTTTEEIEFDNERFDTQGFDVNNNLPTKKDYICINIGSKDRNPWSRYNRWFHKSVIEQSAVINKQPVEIDQSARATRPIIEFDAGMQLWNFGRQAKANVNLIDTTTTDVFSTIEGQTGYYVDGVELLNGMRILFAADTDIRVNGRIFKVKFYSHLGVRRLSLIPEDDTDPIIGETVLVLEGSVNRGKMFHFTDTAGWVEGQRKTTVNQPPMFEVVNYNGDSFGDSDIYPGTTFKGSKIFSYRPGNVLDSELNFEISYKNIGNFGDILFDFNLHIDTFNYRPLGTTAITSVPLTIGYALKHNGLLTINKLNGWTTGFRPSKQYVIKQYDVDLVTNKFPIDVYKNSATLTDLDLRVTVNNATIPPSEYTISKIDTRGFLQFNRDLVKGDVVIIKTSSDALKTVQGYYDFPPNLEYNPENINMDSFTLGELINHAKSIAENTPSFTGILPGVTNLRDLGNVSSYGTRIVQHSAPLAPVVYHLTHKTNNVISALRTAKTDYAKFKRILLRTSETFGFDGLTSSHLDVLLEEITKDNNKNMSYYLSDMVASGAHFVFEQEVIDDSITSYPLTFDFSLNDLSEKAVLVYLNDELLAHGRDYIFTNLSFVDITAPIVSGDIIKISQYEKTDGCYVPPTPTKLGIYPKFIPSISVDTTYRPRVISYTTKKDTFNFYVDNFHHIILDTQVVVTVNSQVAILGIDYSLVRGDRSASIEFNNPVIENSFVSIEVPYVSIQGHDGSRTIAFGDFRDDILLEFEKRIFNNIKISYDTELFDIYDFVSGYYRKTDVPLVDLNSTVRQEFLNWTSLISDDYTQHNFYNRDDLFTYNYRNFTANDGETAVPGFWRGIYKFFYDTDRPHTHPWEMLGFFDRPTWWISTYGNAPYTKDNLVLWRDISEGIIRIPGKYPKRYAKFARPDILSHIPVDEAGHLLDPLTSGHISNFVSTLAIDNFEFGDQSPVETAWRLSSEYPFALITALTLLRPAKIFSTCFDRSRQFRDQTGQIVYKVSNGNLRFNLDNLVYPSIVTDTVRSFTSGLVNYIVDYITGRSLNLVDTYKSELTALDIKMATKLGGFATKEKFRLLLDSRSPTNTTSVFVPFENYDIVLNTSSPVLSVTYSGVIVEKRANGYVLRGYNQVVPEFKYLQSIETASDPIITIGGLPEAFVTWAPNATYAKNTTIRQDGTYYRTIANHTSSQVFETKYFAKLSALPVAGGTRVYIRQQFKQETASLHYGATLETMQQVVDFLIGYGKYLESQGFKFEFFNTILSTVVDWQVSAKEFVFWASQPWAEGSMISLSPAADELTFEKEYAVVDNTKDSFYGYSLLKHDGAAIDPKFIYNGPRTDNSFTIRTKNTSDGIYHLTLNLVQKEHVLIVDDVTVFNDVIFEKKQGYHQERIKVAGYRTAGWQGNFDAPGFIYDNAIVVQWEPWRDYALGTTVKYKEFYYCARENTPGTETFNETSWDKLAKKPETRLLPNWDYKARQFSDFYDLDTDSFDNSQQKFAQHLIGYQPRQYLENIVNDSVAQYKFYQGMIREKGSKNSLSKLFDSLSAADKESLEFYEEWAIRLGQYGASSAFDEIEYKLNEQKFLLNPQPIELVQIIDPTLEDFAYRITPSEVYIKSENYTHAPLPVTNDYIKFLTSPGYARADDVQYVIPSFNDLLTYDIKQLKEGDYFWLGIDGLQWDIYRFTSFARRVDFLEITTSGLRFNLLNSITPDIKVGSIIGIYNASEELNGLYAITDVGATSFVIEKPANITQEILDEIINRPGGDPLNPTITLYKFLSYRARTINEFDNLPLTNKKVDELVWLDGISDTSWEVIKHNSSYSMSIIDDSREGFAENIIVSSDDSFLVSKAGLDLVLFKKSIRDNKFIISDSFAQLDKFSSYPVLGDMFAYSMAMNRPSEIAKTFIGNNVTTEFVFLDLRRVSKGIVVSVDSVPKLIDVDYTVNYAESTITFEAAPPAGATVEIRQSFGSGKFLVVGVPSAGTVNEPNKGQLFVYEQDAGFYYKPLSVINSTIPAANENFGHRIAIENNKIYVISNGSNSVEPALSVFSFAGELLIRRTLGLVGESVTSMDISQDETVVISKSTGTVTVYQLVIVNEIAALNVIQTLTYTSASSVGINDRSNFGASAAVTRDSSTLAIGATQYSEEYETHIGAVAIYNRSSSGQYQVVTKIKSHVIGEGENFGSIVKFVTNKDRLIVYSPGGRQTFNTTFDNGSTTFDLRSTNFIDNSIYTGSIEVFEKYKDRYIFADELETTEVIGENYGSKFVVTNTVYINDTAPSVSFRATVIGNQMTVTEMLSGKLVVGATIGGPGLRPRTRIVKIVSGNGGTGVYTLSTSQTVTSAILRTVNNIYVFDRAAPSWTVYRTPDFAVNLDKIKAIFLYNTDTNEVLQKLDFIDPIQGKILGIADQELAYKTYYDPAVYSVGTSIVNVDTLAEWKKDHVGRLWWNLSTARFIDPYQGSVTYKANTWNELYPGSTVDIFEWVETEYLPSEWDTVADTEEGLTQGISGTSKYGDDVYSVDRIYDNISKTFKNIYYFWVKNKTITPAVEFRKTSARDVAGYIADPMSKGIRYISLLGQNQFALVNCKDLLADSKVAINIQIWNIDNTQSNSHSHYQLLADGDVTKPLNKQIEMKWFDSLIGFDLHGNSVPDIKLPKKLQYGILATPRQSMFVNRIEALKQFVERTNSVLISTVLTDDYDLSPLDAREEAPKLSSNEYDVAIDTYSEIRFVGTAKLERATVQISAVNGKLNRIIVTNKGRGYKLPPKITIHGGFGAVITPVINLAGELVSVTIENPGYDYPDAPTAIVRPFTVLVNNDETAAGRWSIYVLNTKNIWSRVRTQVYDTTLFWEYVDWYAPGYSLFTQITHIVDFAYQLPSTTIKIGDTIKVNNGGSGWLLLEKTNNELTLDTTVNYKVVGKQRGTIQLKNNLYNFAASSQGFDGTTFDGSFYDIQPKEELRIILNTLRDNILVDELELEYNRLFFASLRYAFSEQPFVDWAFKTSFIRARHNVGQLSQPVTLETSNINSYEDYIQEAKPYRSKLREFISNYDRLEAAPSMVTDFDLSPRFDYENLQIVPFKVSVKGSAVEYDTAEILTYPYANWYNNVGNGVLEIVITDAGSGYKKAPIVEIVGDARVQAKAKAYIGRGRVTKIIVTESGSGYLTTPTIILNGSTVEGGVAATAVAIMDVGLVRSTKIGVKFDRISATYQTNTITHVQSFAGTGSRTVFDLKYPVDIKSNTVLVTVSNDELLSNDFTVYNVLDTSSSYTRYKGVLELTIPATLTDTVVINYRKDVSLLDAADRIQYYYPDTPSAGMLGKSLGQLMTGVDYGGVEVTGIGFEIGSGWDALPWIYSRWDSYDSEYDDLLVVSNAVTRSFTLSYVPAVNELITVYLNGVRLDDTNYQEYTASVQELDSLRDDLSILLVARNSAQDSVLLIQSELDNLLAQLAVVNQELEDTTGLTPEEISDLIDERTYLQTEVNLKTALLDNAEEDLNETTALVDLKKTAILQVEEEGAIIYAAMSNKSAIMETFVGDGITDTIVLPNSANFLSDTIDPSTGSVVSNNAVIFRKTTSDGSFRPESVFFDTELIGGDLSYTTARGVSPEEIIIDGDGFVTPVSSHAPEEVVPGQVVDTLDIQIYQLPQGGAPVVLTQYYKGDNTTTNFSIGQIPNTVGSVSVSVNRNVLTPDDDFTVDVETQTVILSVAPDVGHPIAVTSLSKNGLDVLDTAVFVGDGSTTEFITAVKNIDSYTVYVTVNGVPTVVDTFVIDDMSDEVGNVGLLFLVAPTPNAVINYIVLRGTENESISNATVQKINYTGANSYSLEITPLIARPDLEVAEWVETTGAGPFYVTFKINPQEVAPKLGPNYTVDGNTNSNFNSIVEVVASTTLTVTVSYQIDPGQFSTLTATQIIQPVVMPSANNMVLVADGKVLNPPDNIYFDVVSNIRTFIVSSADYASNTISANEIRVYLNGIRLTLGTNYSWSSSANRLTLRSNVARDGDVVTLEINKLADYQVTGSTITLFNSYEPGIDVTVTTFTNHTILGITRSIESVNVESNLVPGTADYFRNAQVTNGRIKLRTAVSGSQYVWVTLNTELLIPEVDYVLDENGQYVKLNPDLRLENNDIIDVMTLGETIIKSAFAYRMFKDMLNRSTYKRMDDESTTMLVSPLKYADLDIYVQDSSNLSNPDRENKRPGVVFIDGERIEYYQKSGNKLTRLHRGTLGTGIKDEYSVGTLVRDQSVGQTIPYKDEVVTSVSTSDGQTLRIPVDFMPALTASTTAVNNTWYRKTIPSFYGQCDDVEVFVAGRRLRKSPMLQSDPTVSAYSPENDVYLEAEFSVDGTTAEVRLTTPAPVGTLILIQKRIGKTWVEQGNNIVGSLTPIASFIKAKTISAPTKPVNKYVDVAADRAIYLEDLSSTLDDESGNSLEWT